MKKVVFCLLILSLMACSESRPKFYPNAKLNKVGMGQAEQDTNECMSLADTYVPKKSMAGEAAKRGLIGGAVGAGTGAVGGTIMKAKVGRATGAGAAIGTMLGVGSGIYETSGHSQDYKSFVERCLQKKGYETIGWD